MLRVLSTTLQSTQDANRLDELRSLSHMHLVAVRSELLLGLVIDLGGLLGLGQLPPCCLLALVVCSTLDLSSLLESVATKSVFRFSL